MTATRTLLTESINEGVENYTSRATDADGRTIGARLTYSVQVFADITDDAPAAWSTVKAGTYYAVKMQATRDGQPFGASQADRLFASADARIEAVDTYINKRGLR